MQGPDVYYNWVIPGDMFRPLNGHIQAETCRQVQPSCNKHLVLAYVVY